MTGSGAMPPHDLAAEMAVLGSMMLSADALADCLEVLTPGQECFFRPAHQMAYEAIRFLADDAQPVDALTVKAEMERRGELSRAGGADYLHTLIASVPAPLTARTTRGNCWCSTRGGRSGSPAAR